MVRPKGRRGRLRTALCAVALLLVPASRAAADYVDGRGNTVHWAGGNNIVVTDARGNTVYVGQGVRQGQHLYMPGQAPGAVGAGAVVVSAAGPLGLVGSGGGQAWGGRAYGGKTAASPFPGATQMADLQPVALDRGLAASLGLSATQYAEVFTNGVDPGGVAAIPETSQLGQILAAHGFARQGGWVLLHGQPGVSWQPSLGDQPGPSLTSVSQVQPGAFGGGVIRIDLGSILGSGGRPAGGCPGCGAGGTRSAAVSIDSASVVPDPAVYGQPVTLSVNTSGPVQAVTVSLPWDGRLPLTRGSAAWTVSFPAAGDPGVQPEATFTLRVEATGSGGQAAQRDVTLAVVPQAPRLAQVVAPASVRFGDVLAVRAVPAPGGQAGPVTGVTLEVRDLRPVLPPVSVGGRPVPGTGGANPDYGQPSPFYPAPPGWQPGAALAGARVAALHLTRQADGSWEGWLVAGSWVTDAGTFAALQAGAPPFPFELVVTAQGPGGSDTRSSSALLQGSVVDVLPQAG